MRSLRLLLVALGSALSALLVSPVAAAAEPMARETPSEIDDLTLVSAGTLRANTERTPAIVLGLKTFRPGEDPEIVGVFLFSRRPAPAPRRPRPAPPIRIAPARQNGVWVLIAEGRF